MPRSERVWRGRSILVGVGPLEVPSAAATADALTRLALAGPDARVGLRFDPHSRRRWIYGRAAVEDWMRSCICVLPAGADEDMDVLLTQLGDRPDDRPLRVYLADRHILVHTDHALLDSKLAGELPLYIVSVSRGGALPRWATTPVDPRPLATALRATFGDVGRVRSLTAELRADRLARAQLSPLEDGPAVTPFRPSPVAVNEIGPPGGARTLHSWARLHAPGAALFSVVLTAVHHALGEEGIASATGVHLLYDLRRYLPRRHRSGSFVIGVDMPYDVADPVQLTAAVDRTHRSGRPLATLTVAALRPHLRPETRPRAAPVIAVHPHARLAYSYVGMKKLSDDLPWLVDREERRFWTRLQPAGPADITLLALLTSGRLTIHASFHSTVFDPARVRGALRRVHDDPTGVLTRALAADETTRT